MLTIGQQVPDFELPNQEGKRTNLSDFRGQKVIIFAFPRAGTAGCTAQACAFRDEAPDITSRNAVILGISADAPDALKRWKKNQKLPYDLLSDEHHQVLEALGAWGVPLLGFIKVPTIQRSYWVIDENGLLLDQQIGVGPKESARKALEAVGETSAAV